MITAGAGPLLAAGLPAVGRPRSAPHPRWSSPGARPPPPRRSPEADPLQVDHVVEQLEPLDPAAVEHERQIRVQAQRHRRRVSGGGGDGQDQQQGCEAGVQATGHGWQCTPVQASGPAPDPAGDRQGATDTRASSASTWSGVTSCMQRLAGQRSSSPVNTQGLQGSPARRIRTVLADVAERPGPALRADHRQHRRVTSPPVRRPRVRAHQDAGPRRDGHAGGSECARQGNTWPGACEQLEAAFQWHEPMRPQPARSRAAEDVRPVAAARTGPSDVLLEEVAVGRVDQTIDALDVEHRPGGLDPQAGVNAPGAACSPTTSAH